MNRLDWIHQSGNMTADSRGQDPEKRSGRGKNGAKTRFYCNRTVKEEEEDERKCGGRTAIGGMCQRAVLHLS